VKLTREQVLHIAELAKLRLTEDETEMLADQLSEMLDHFAVLNQLDTDTISPTAQAIYRRNVLRDDLVAASLSPEQVLANAPRRLDDQFQVKPILD
jgi:aspartyl-tRNA(Asn)/glutamyl-tRNA(Gln) amidotransferase subunit C